MTSVLTAPQYIRLTRCMVGALVFSLILILSLPLSLETMKNETRVEWNSDEKKVSHRKMLYAIESLRASVASTFYTNQSLAEAAQISIFARCIANKMDIIAFNRRALLFFFLSLFLWFVLLIRLKITVTTENLIIFFEPCMCTHNPAYTVDRNSIKRTSVNFTHSIALVQFVSPIGREE